MFPPTHLFTTMKAVLLYLDRIEEYLAATLLAITVIVNFVNVVGRYFLQASFGPSEEIMVNAFVWSSFLGMAAGVRRGAHLGLTFLVDALPPRLRGLVTVITSLLGAAFMAFLLKEGIAAVQLVIQAQQTSPALGLPEWVYSMSVPAGATLMGIRFVQAAWLALLGRYRLVEREVGQT